MWGETQAAAYSRVSQSLPWPEEAPWNEMTGAVGGTHPRSKHLHALPALEVTSCSTRGRLVTMPDPRGRKSLKRKNYNNRLSHSEILIIYKFIS